jgi:hypothetical protein
MKDDGFFFFWIALTISTLNILLAQIGATGLAKFDFLN